LNVVDSFIVFFPINSATRLNVAYSVFVSRTSNRIILSLGNRDSQNYNDSFIAQRVVYYASATVFVVRANYSVGSFQTKYIRRDEHYVIRRMFLFRVKAYSRYEFVVLWTISCTTNGALTLLAPETKRKQRTGKTINESPTMTRAFEFIFERKHFIYIL